jgi:hypothetical protein
MEFDKFLDAILGQGAGAPIVTMHTPFGRDEEIAELANKLNTISVVAIVADRCLGKSSLALAGLIPVFRRHAR